MGLGLESLGRQDKAWLFTEALPVCCVEAGGICQGDSIVSRPASLTGSEKHTSLCEEPASACRREASHTRGWLESNESDLKKSSGSGRIGVKKLFFIENSRGFQRGTGNGGAPMKSGTWLNPVQETQQVPGPQPAYSNPLGRYSPKPRLFSKWVALAVTWNLALGQRN